MSYPVTQLFATNSDLACLVRSPVAHWAMTSTIRNALRYQTDSHYEPAVQQLSSARTNERAAIAADAE